jgi:hypothetical protein
MVHLLIAAGCHSDLHEPVMIRIPAPYLRGLAVLSVGLTFVFGHAALATPGANASKPAARTQLALSLVQDGAMWRQGPDALELAENCYLEVQEDLTPEGKTVSRIVHECD